MTKPLQETNFFEFRDRIMGMSDSKNIAEVKKVRDEIAQKEDLENGRTARGFESKQFTQTQTVRVLESKQFTKTNVEFKSTRSEPAGVCWKSENGESEKRKIENDENRFEIFRDDDDVID